MEKLYCINNDEIVEYPIVHDSLDYFHIYDANEQKVLRVSRRDVVIKDDVFKAKYCNRIFNNHYYDFFDYDGLSFANRRLAEAYLEAVRNFGGLWKAEHDVWEYEDAVQTNQARLDHARERLDKAKANIEDEVRDLCNIEDRIRKLGDTIDDYSRQLDEAKAERERLIAKQEALADE